MAITIAIHFKFFLLFMMIGSFIMQYSIMSLIMTNDKEINDYIMIINLTKSQRNATTSDLSVGDSVRLRISDGFRKGTDPRYSGTVHKINVIYGRNIILDNGKKYIRANLLKVRK